MDETERRTAGLQVRREILGDAYVDRALADLGIARHPHTSRAVSTTSLSLAH